MQTLAVFPGTFDPLTLGHLDIIKRASKIFDIVIIAVAKSPSKHTLFDFLKEKNANILVRGVRTVADYDYETQLAGMYRIAMPDMEIVMLPTNASVSFISSTLVREVIIHKGDISKFVPEAVYSYVNKH